MIPEDIEDVRRMAHRKYNKRYHSYINSAIDKTVLHLNKTTLEVPITTYDPPDWTPRRTVLRRGRDQLHAECLGIVKPEVLAEVPKTGLFSFIFLSILSGAISWVVHRLLDKYYGK